MLLNTCTLHIAVIFDTISVWDWNYFFIDNRHDYEENTYKPPSPTNIIMKKNIHSGSGGPGYG